MPENQIKVTLMDHMGSDLTVVNAARVSFDKESKWIQRVYEEGHHEHDVEPKLTDEEVPASYEPYEDWPAYYDENGRELSGFMLSKADTKLIKYLAEHKHMSPFGHCFMSFRVKAPIFVARQLVKHKFLRWNEVSRRYVTTPPEFYQPEHWRMKVENVKQGSSNEHMIVDGQKVCKYCQLPLEFVRKEDEKMKFFCDSKCQSAYYRKHTDKGWASTKIGRLKQSAKKRGLECSITTEDLMELGRPLKCKYLNIELDYAAEGVQPNSPSVNRIDNSKGYSVGNIEIISNKANSMLLDATPDELMTFAKNVVFHNGGVFMDTAQSIPEFYENIQDLYDDLVSDGMCAEQARMFMPQSQLTEWWWSGSLDAFADMCRLRLDPHAQYESRLVAQQINEVGQRLYPVSWEALLNG